MEKILRSYFCQYAKIVAYAFFFFPMLFFGQSEKPKVALVLSGGGAKGIAHIPVLQAMDSLNIVPDLIIGTSMGSIVGGLYAMGYSGDSIAYMVKNTAWGKLLGGKTPLNNVSVEEKSEFDKYTIGFGFTKGKLQTTAYLLNDQNLRDNLTILTLPAYNITNFDSLPIPYRAVTADIINSKQKVLDSGALNTAMRASMSIPGVFEPVRYENTLLVDGGVLNNFPTDVAKSLGADIIIGSDVTGAGKTLKELETLGSIFSQTMMMAHHKIYPENRKLCDIFIDHLPNLSYSTADFIKSAELYEEGKIATAQNIGALTALADRLKTYQQRPHQLPYFEDKIILSDIVYENIAAKNLGLIKSRVGLKPNVAYTKKDMVNSIKRTMGTRIFEKVAYKPILADNKESLLITGTEKPKHQLNGSLHYDLYRGIGVIGNYSGRNVLGSASRLLVSLDIAEQPKFLVQLQKNFGKKENWWWRSEAVGRQLKQRVFIDGEVADDLREKSFQYTNQINRNINSLNSYFGFGLNYRYTDIKPTIAPEINENVLALRKYFSSYIGIDAHFEKNTFNSVFYAERGSLFKATINRSLAQHVDATSIDPTAVKVKGRTNNFTKIQFDLQKRVPIKEQITGIVEVAAGFTFDDQLVDRQVDFLDFGYPELFFLGGNLPIQRPNSFGFQGLQEDELVASQFALLKLGLQVNPANNFYITPHFNIASVGFENFKEYTNNVLSPNGDWQNLDTTSFLLSAGTMVSYNSILGPVDFNISWTNNINKVRFFLSVGIPFNR